MSTASPNPNNMLILAVIGIGAFWMMTRRATARPYQVKPANAAQGSTAAKVNALSSLINSAGRLFGGGGSAAQATGPSLIPNDDTAGQPGYGWQYFTNGTAISPSGTYYHQGQPVWSPDGQVINPPGNVSAWDAEYAQMIGM